MFDLIGAFKFYTNCIAFKSFRIIGYHKQVSRFSFSVHIPPQMADRSTTPNPTYVFKAQIASYYHDLCFRTALNLGHVFYLDVRSFKVVNEVCVETHGDLIRLTVWDALAGRFFISELRGNITSSLLERAS